jgi:hypothetical protein
MILAMDTEGYTWREIDRLDGLHHSMHQVQGHLCVCTIDGPNDSKLSIWILEDYDTDNWTLKHMVTAQILFGSINISFGWPDFDDEDIVIIVHPKQNLIFFAILDRSIIAYNMDRKKFMSFMSVFWYGRCTIKKEFTCRPYYLPYVLLFLDSIAEK